MWQGRCNHLAHILDRKVLSASIFFRSGNRTIEKEQMFEYILIFGLFYILLSAKPVKAGFSGDRQSHNCQQMPLVHGQQYGQLTLPMKYAHRRLL
jgi:hypothetical protein